MLETIRQFAEEQLVARGEAAEARTAHARHFAGREADILALWDGPRQREAYDWFAVELANLRTAFRWAADRGDLDDAATIATYAAFLGFWVENYEPIAWAEELIERARSCRPSPARVPVCDGLAVLLCPDALTRLCVTATQARRSLRAAWARCRSASKACCPTCTCTQPSLNGPPIGAAAGFRAVATRTHGRG